MLPSRHAPTKRLFPVAKPLSFLPIPSSSSSSSSSTSNCEHNPPSHFHTTPPNPRYYADLLTSLSKRAVRFDTHHPFVESPHRTQAIKICKTVHACILKSTFQFNASLGNALVDLYSKCGDIRYARGTFDRLEQRDSTVWNSILSAHAKQDSPEVVLCVFREMQASASRPDQFGHAIALSACGRLAELDLGRSIHGFVLKSGFGKSSHCEGALVDMYAKCSRVVDARRLFDGVECPDTISWTSMIVGYVRIGLPEEALELFWRMLDVGGMPDQVTLVAAITACLSLGRLEDARSLFIQMDNPNIIAWNSIISGHARSGHLNEALFFYREMTRKSVRPNRSTLGSVLSAIANLMAVDEGQRVHSEAIRLGLDFNVFVGSSLISMYAKCCKIEDARRVFDTLEEKNIVIWNAMLGGYVQNGKSKEVIKLFSEMREARFHPDEFSLVSVFGACVLLEDVDLGKQVHSLAVKDNLNGSLYVGNAVVDMYAKCGEMNDAALQFELIPERDVISWNAIVGGYVHNRCEDEALSLFRRMRLEAVVPDEFSFASIISACTNLQAFEEGKQIHCLSIKSDLHSSLFTGSCLIDLYAKHGEMHAAKQVFQRMPEKNLVSRNVVISGHVLNNNEEEAFDLFRQMQIDGLEPSEMTFASILPGCYGSSGFGMGTQIHCYMLKSGLLYNDDFLGVSLLGMYCKCNALEDAKRLFMEMPNNKSLVLWTSLMSGLVQNGCSDDGLMIFQKMLSHDVRPDEAAFSSALRACADRADLKIGKLVHGLIIKGGFGAYGHASSALVDMYSKCGDVRDSFLVFEELNKEDVISWNSMIVGFAKNGYAEDALLLFQQMQQLQVKPDDITFLGVLTACSHGGLVSEARDIFDTMVNEYKFTPKADHYACILDLLGRGGYLKEAEELINRLPFAPDGVLWATLLAACRTHGDEGRAQRAAEKLIELEPHNSSPYVLLSNVYGTSGNWAGVKIVREAMRVRGVRKSPGCSWVILGKDTSLFLARDQMHPKAAEIYTALNGLITLMKDDGYVAELELFLMDEDEVEVPLSAQGELEFPVYLSASS